MMKGIKQAICFCVFVIVCSITVLPVHSEAKVNVKSVSVESSTTGSRKKIVVVKGKSVKLTTSVSVVPNKKENKTVSYIVKDKEIATVSSNGIVKGKKAGTTKIIVTSKKNKKKKAYITVKVMKDAVKSVKFNKNSALLNVGETLSLKTTVSASKKAEKSIVYSSSNEKIAKVNNKGVITAVTEGKVTITATAIDGSGKKATCKVTVSQKNEMEKETTQSTEQEKNQKEEKVTVSDSGDGWSLKNGVLYISKMYYSICNTVDNKYCWVDEPWSKYDDCVTQLVIDADMVLVHDDYATEINAGNNTTNGEESMLYYGLFVGMDSLKSVTISRWNLDQMTDISLMFARNPQLTAVDVSGWDVSNVKDASQLFLGDVALESIDLSSWDTSGFVNVSGMFEDCSNLKSVGVSSWNTTNIKNFSHMFRNCSSLVSVNLDSWSIDNADVIGMFHGCKALKDVNLSKVTMNDTCTSNEMFDTDNSISSYMFAAGWEVGEVDNIPILLIGDDLYDVVFVPVEEGKVRGYIFYKKIVPEWCKKEVEWLANCSDMTEILHTPMFCVFESGSAPKDYVDKLKGELIGITFEDYESFDDKKDEIIRKCEDHILESVLNHNSETEKENEQNE